MISEPDLESHRGFRSHLAFLPVMGKSMLMQLLVKQNINAADLSSGSQQSHSALRSERGKHTLAIGVPCDPGGCLLCSITTA